MVCTQIWSRTSGSIPKKLTSFRGATAGSVGRSVCARRALHGKIRALGLAALFPFDSRQERSILLEPVNHALRKIMSLVLEDHHGAGHLDGSEAGLFLPGRLCREDQLPCFLTNLHLLELAGLLADHRAKIGRASCRERGWTP